MSQGPLSAEEEVTAEPFFPGRSWQMFAGPEEAGFSAAKLAEARRSSEEIGSAAVMVVHRGAVAAHWGEIETRFMCHSVRKSFLSALYGAHVDAGTLDLDATLAELGIDDDPPLTPDEQRAPVRDLLTARSGVYHSAAYETEAMKKDRPARGAHPPDAFYYYNNWDFNALATILDKHTRSTVFEEFERRIARPLGMEDFRVRDGYYHLEAEHSRHPAYPFRMSARDMARFGLLYLREGRWGERRVLSEAWVKESTRSWSEVDDERGYGYLWWTLREEPFRSLGAYAARGFGGHSIVVVPEADLVFVHRVNTWWDLDFPGCPKPPEHKVETKERLKLLEMILDAKTGEAKERPELVPLPAAPPQEGGVDPAMPDRFAGRYEFAGGHEVEVSMEGGGALFLNAPRAGTFALLPSRAGTFVMEDIGAPVSFVEDGEGHPLAMAVELADGKPGYGRFIPSEESGERTLNTLTTRLEALTPRLMQGHKVPGVSVAVIWDGEIAWEKGYGVATAGAERLVTPATVFEACSMSKVAFAYVVLKLAEEGKIELDRPLVEYLEKPYLEGVPPHREITARMVLAHTSGMPNWREGGWRKGGPLEVKFTPGTRYGYSGEGFLYLQRVVEEITGERLEIVMKKRLLDPLGMASSSYVWEERFEETASAGHDEEGNVKPDRAHFREGNAAYTLYCTAGDYAKFIVEVMKADRSAAHSIGRESLDAMLRPHIAVTGSHGDPIPRSGPEEIVSVSRGLGWVLGETRGGAVRAWHSGSNGTGFRCHSEFDPASRCGIVLMTGAVNGDALCRDLLRRCDFP